MAERDKKWKQWENLPPEIEEELIEKIARFFVDRKMGLIGQMMLESASPIARIFSEIAMNIYGPYLDYLNIDTYTALFRKKENIDKLIKRIEELEEEEMK